MFRAHHVLLKAYCSIPHCSKAQQWVVCSI